VRRAVASAALALLALPAAALAVPGGPSDGTLAVTSATGSVSIAARGALIGQLDRGKVVLEDPDPKDGKQPVVWGYESKRDVTDTKALYAGTNIRFRIIGGFFRVKVVGSGMDLSLVGHGSVTLSPLFGLISAGTYSVNGEDEVRFPDQLTSVQLGAPPAPGG
jgi:hypothetical protein